MFTVLSIQSLDRTLTLALNGSASLYLDHLAWLSTKTITWLPLVLVLVFVLLRNNDWRRTLSIVLFLALAILLADHMASGICKPLFERFRPSQNPDLIHYIDVVRGYRGGSYGFFSSHAANTMAVATFLTLLVRSSSLGCYLYSWVVLNCWTRVYLGVHYVGDLLTGLLWGGIVGWLTYLVWQKFFGPKRSSRGMQGDPNIQTLGGYAVIDVNILINSLILTYLFIAIAAFIIV